MERYVSGQTDKERFTYFYAFLEYLTKGTNSKNLLLLFFLKILRVPQWLFLLPKNFKDKCSTGASDPSCFTGTFWFSFPKTVISS